VLLVLVVLVPAIAVGWLVFQVSGTKRLAMEKIYEDARTGYLEVGRSTAVDEIDRLRAEFDRIMAETSPLDRWTAIRNWGQPDGYVRTFDSATGNTSGGLSEPVLKKLMEITLLQKSGDTAGAADEIDILLGQPGVEAERMADGRMLAPMLAYLAADLSKDGPMADEYRARFRSMVLDDEVQSAMPPGQAQFSLGRIREWDDSFEVASASKFAETTLEWTDTEVRAARDSGIPGVEVRGELVGLHSRDSGDLIVLRMDKLVRQIQVRLDELPERAGGRLELRKLRGAPEGQVELPGNLDESNHLEMGPLLPGWAVVFVGDDQVAVMGRADREVLGLIAIGAVVIGLSVFLSLALYKVIQNQARLAQLKNDLVATVSHELKTPVASIRLLVDTLMRDENADPARVRDYLGLISRENKRLGHLIENFLSFSRMERNKDSFDLQPVSPGKLAFEAEAVFRERQSSWAGTLQMEIEDALPSIEADGEALQTAIGNLLENAEKYGGDNPRIVLSVTRTPDVVEFSVKDNGMGISKEDQKRIFEKFYQARTRLSEHVGGVGLGLSIVSFIVDKHGGELRVESRPEQGSVFTIRIPYTDA